MNNWLLKPSKNKLSDMLWNMIGAGLFAGQAALLLVVVARKYNIEIAGVVTIAYALANLIMTIGKYGVRNFQATDVNYTYSFKNYLHGRIITIAISIALGLGYLGIMILTGGYTLFKALLIVEIIALKTVDALADVFLGEYQRNGRFVVGARVMAIQQALVTVAIIATMCMGLSIQASFLIGTATSLLIVIVLTFLTISCAKSEKNNSKGEGIASLLKACFPLCVGLALAIYVGNIPKYAIDLYLDDKTQAIFGYLMLPVFVVTLMNQFIYMPYVKELGDLWDAGDTMMLKKKIIRQCVYVAAIALIALVGCVIIGLPVLSVLYNVKLTVYTKEFIVLLLGGSVYALAFYFTIPLTTMRRQNAVAIGYIVVSVLAVATQKYFAVNYGMMGVSWLYVIVNTVLLLFYAVILKISLNK